MVQPNAKFVWSEDHVFNPNTVSNYDFSCIQKTVGLLCADHTIKLAVIEEVVIFGRKLRMGIRIAD